MQSSLAMSSGFQSSEVRGQRSEVRVQGAELRDERCGTQMGPLAMSSSDASAWKCALDSYGACIQSLSQTIHSTKTKKKKKKKKSHNKQKNSKKNSNNNKKRRTEKVCKEEAVAEAAEEEEEEEEGGGGGEEDDDDDDLTYLNHFYTVSLPDLIRSRFPAPFITKQELIHVLKWKLCRGKWRPRLMDFVSSLDDREIQAVSKASFSSLPDLKSAITTLSSLKGVGPATASAVLAVFAPDIAPFMSDEAMVAVLGGVKDYSLKQYLLFAEKLQNKAQELTKSSNLKLTPCDLERALWCSEMQKRLPMNVRKQTNDELASVTEEKLANSVGKKSTDNPSCDSPRGSSSKRRKRK